MDERFAQHGQFWEALLSAKAAQSPDADLDDIAVSMAIVIAGLEVETLRVRNMRFRVAEYLAFVLVDRPDLLVEAIRRALGESTARGNAHLNDRPLVVLSDAKRLRDDNC
jgi:hypothetical protein